MQTNTLLVRRTQHTQPDTDIQGYANNEQEPTKRNEKKRKKRIKIMNERNYMKLFRKLSDNETRAHTDGMARRQRANKRKWASA